MLFLSGVFLQDVVDGPERELGRPVAGQFPKLPCFFRPVLLLRWVVNVADGLGPGVSEAVGEVSLLPKLVSHLSVGLPDEPGLVFARVGIVCALFIPVVNGLLLGERKR